MAIFDASRPIFDLAAADQLRSSLEISSETSLPAPPATWTRQPSPPAANDQGARAAGWTADWAAIAGLFFTAQGFSLGGSSNHRAWSVQSASGAGQPQRLISGGGGSDNGGPLSYGGSAYGGSGGGNGPLSYGGGNKAPRVTSTHKRIVQDEVMKATAILKAVDSDGTVVRYRFKDSVGGGWFVLNGKRLAENKWHTIKASQRSSLIYVAADDLTNRNFRFDDQIRIRAQDDDKAWSRIKSITLKNFHNANRPIVYTTDQTVESPKTLQMSSVFSVRDEDRNTIKSYRFLDASKSGSTGFLTYKGKAVKAGKWLRGDRCQPEVRRLSVSTRRGNGPDPHRGF